jgi:thiamine pyrophosphate-dependent acetolactate synthase large subunit-like protein
MKPRRGPVCVNLPRNILQQQTLIKSILISPLLKARVVLKVTMRKLKKAAKIINQANQFVIIAGGGIKYTSKYKEVIKLAELLNIPIVTAAGHGDAIPFSHKLKCRARWGLVEILLHQDLLKKQM